MSGLVEVAILAGVLLTAITWVVVGLFAPRSAASSASPGRRAFVARGWLYAVLWVPPLVLVAALLPGLLAASGKLGDHCLAHGHGHHHHLCLLHPPHATGHWLTWVAPLLVASPAVLVLLRWAWRDRWQRGLARTLVATSRPSQLGAEVRLIEQSEPLALTVGARSPTILLSTGLLERVSARALEVVLAHERAHVARGDTRLARVDRLVASLLPSGVARALLDQITLAREQACDAAAVERVGDPVTVARALTEIARLGMRVPTTGVSVASAPLRARVLHLLEPPSRSRRAWLVPACVLVALVVAGAGPVHGAVEHLITFVLH